MRLAETLPSDTQTIAAGRLAATQSNTHMKKPSYVTRFDYPSFHGWWARIQSHKLTKYVGDTKYGGKSAARAAAIAQVKRWLQAHDDIGARGHHLRSYAGKKDVAGVSRTVTVKRAKTSRGVKIRRYFAYTATAVDPRTKKQLKKSWGVLSYGQRGAKQKAMQWRAAMVKKIDKWYRTR